MASIITSQDFDDVKRDIEDTGKAVNTDAVITPRYGDVFKSIPMVSREAQEGFVAQQTELAQAINIALAAGAGASGWTASLIADNSGDNQQQINSRGGALWYNKAGGYDLNDRVILANGDTVKSTIANNTNDPNSNMTGWKNPNDTLIHIVSTIAELSLLSGKNGDVVYVLENEKRYLYDSTISAASNGVTIIGKWEMEIQEAYYASWFATPDVVIDQSLKLQAGHDYAASKDRTYIIDDVFHVEANQTYMSIDNNAFIIRDYSKVTWLPNAKLIQINQNKNQSNLVLMMRTVGATLIRPVGVGDRLENMALGSHTSDAQGYGYGLTLYETQDCLIYEPNFSQNHGDNIYVGKPWGSDQDILPTDTTIVRPICHHARRNCISLTAWSNVKIIDPDLSYGGDSDGITGAFPKSCIDIELENADGFTEAHGYQGLITNPYCHDSDNGLFVYASLDNRNFDMHIQGMLTIENISTIGLGMYHGATGGVGNVIIDAVKYLSIGYQEMSIGWNKNSNLKATIDHVYPVYNDTSFEIASQINGAYVGKTLGNFSINNLHTVGFTPFTCDVGTDYVIDGYRFQLAKDAKAGINYYTNNAALQADARGSDTFIESKDSYDYLGFSVSTAHMPNEIWQIPYDESTFAYINSTGDYRVLKIGLKFSGIVGQGCLIQGLNLLIGGVAKTQANTKTLGGWLKFKNNSGGRTQIIDSYGDWTFS